MESSQSFIFITKKRTEKCLPRAAVEQSSIELTKVCWMFLNFPFSFTKKKSMQSVELRWVECFHLLLPPFCMYSAVKGLFHGRIMQAAIDEVFSGNASFMVVFVMLLASMLRERSEPLDKELPPVCGSVPGWKLFSRML